MLPRTLLALSTGCAPSDLPLDRAVLRLSELGVSAVVLHRAPDAEEAASLARATRRARIVAVFADEPVSSLAGPLRVVEGEAAQEDRERSLLALCRRLHALAAGGAELALRTPPDTGHPPAPAELELVRSELRAVGYWHDTGRGGEEYLEAAARWMRGASFHPLEYEDLAGLRDAMPSRGIATIECAPGTAREELAEAVRRARSYFRA